MKTFIKNHLGEIIVGMVVATFTAAASFALGLYSLTAASEDAYKQQILRSLNAGGRFLEQVESELDENIRLLSEENYEIRFRFRVVGSKTSLRRTPMTG